MSRLEEIKEYFGLWMKNDISRDWSLSSETIDKLKYLIERVQELEETVEDYKTVNKELHLRGRKVRKQNKRYREELDILGEVINSAPNADKLNEEYERLKSLEDEE